MIRKGMFISNRYEILEKVGSGGMSDVYKARCHKLNRFVAIKVLKNEFSEDKNFVSKFRVEAQNAAGLAHPNIVSVYDVGEDQGLYYIVMELIEGITLKQYIARKGKLSVKEAVSIGIQVAQGIECAHNNQIIHRDIKPQNIIISRDGKVKVTDFGIARAASVNTHTTNAMGSVHYISPEQARGGYIDEKSDIYSLGITMFEMLTGHVPFDGDSTVTIALQHIQKQVPDLKEELPDIPVSVEKIVLKCTRNKADDRYLKISSLINDLKRALIHPNEDFVQLEEKVSNGSTVMITDKELAVIRNASGEKDVEVVPEEEEPDEFDIIDEENPKLDRIITIAGVVVVIFIVVVAIVIIKNTFSGNREEPTSLANVETTTLDPKLTVVPNLINLDLDGAKEELKKNSLGIKYEYDYSDTIAKDYVCEQSEEEGSIVDKNSTIYVTISKGAEKVDLPQDMVGKQMEDVVEELEQMGFKYKVKFDFSSSAIGTVLSTDPDGKAQVSKGDTIELTVSRGKESQTDGVSIGKVPSVAGKTRSKAEASIKAAGYKVGEVVEVYSTEVDKGKVIRMTVKPGISLPKGATIGLVVSKGPEEPETEAPTEAPTEAETTAAATYSAQYTFTREDLRDVNGAPITSGAVTIYVDGKKAPIDERYARVESWTDDYVYTVTEEYSGNATLQLFVDNALVVDTVVELK